MRYVVFIKSAMLSARGAVPSGWDVLGNIDFVGALCPLHAAEFRQATSAISDEDGFFMVPFDSIS